MIGHNLVTKQTTAEGRRCEEVMVAKRLFTRREYYFSITLDRITNVILSMNQVLFYCCLGPNFDRLVEGRYEH